MAYSFRPKRQHIVITNADKWFSLFIRIRDCFNSDGYVKCCTCGAVKHFRKMNCGHCVTRDFDPTRFNELNANAQCPQCNGRKKGEQGRHVLYIDKIHGPGTAQRLFDLSGLKMGKYSKDDLKIISEHYRLKTHELAEKKGILL